MNLSVFSLEQLTSVATQILEFAGDSRIFLFYGEMGAGKTTLIKSLCRELGVHDNVTSPTFSIVNEYKGDGKIFHFDFYRIKNQSEAFDMGSEEYFYSGNYCFIEWPEKIPALLPQHFIRLTITVTANNSRQITIDKF